MPGRSSRRLCRAVSLISVAHTVAPSSAKAIAVARPIPWAAAVTNAIFPASLPLIFFFCSRCLVRRSSLRFFKALHITASRGFAGSVELRSTGQPGAAVPTWFLPRLAYFHWFWLSGLPLQPELRSNRILQFIGHGKDTHRRGAVKA